MTTREEARTTLREMLHPGDRVYCILRHRSASGMFRVIQLVMIGPPDRDEEPNLRWIGYWAARAMDDRYDQNREGIAVSGTGMDMGFHLVYNLGATLWPDGYDCPGKRCHSNDHTNGDRDYSPHHHRDGGYALESRWL